MNYEAFILHTNLDYDTEANRFNEDHYFFSELGNTMPLALASAFQFSIVIFSRDPRTRTMYITPEVITTEATAFLIYTPSNQGHYDAAIPCHVVSAQGSSNHSSCRCGINRKMITNETVTNQSCKPSKIYKTRCTCYKESRACTPLC